MRTPTALTLVAALLVGSVGCKSIYNDRYKFTPFPAEARASDNDAAVRTLASVIGVRNPDEKAGVPLSVETRLQVENRGEHPVMLDPRSLRLTSGDLKRFDEPRTTPQDPITIDPGDSATMTALFPFPGDEGMAGVDLSGLNLAWVFVRGAERYPQSATFQRRPIGYDRHHHGPEFGIGIGVGTVID